MDAGGRRGRLSLPAEELLQVNRVVDPRRGINMESDKELANMRNNESINQEELTDTDLSQRILAEGITKLVLKSVKRRAKRDTIRKFKTKKCTEIVTAAKGTDNECILSKAYSRCSIICFYQVIKVVLNSPRMIALVKDMGFQFMLQIDDCQIPRAFVQWLADNASSDGENIILHGVPISLTPEAVVHTFNIPAGDLVVEGDEELGKLCFLELFGLSEVPPTKYFADKIIMEDLTDEMFQRCFLTVCNATFLCPTSSTKPSTKYMGALIDVGRIKDLNWAKFVNDWLKLYIKKYLKEKQKQKRLTITLGGCIYQLAVRCLDFMDFGLIHVPPVFPRICVWKGDLIKHFSNMDLDRNGHYGARPIKQLCDTCYGHASVQQSIGWSQFKRSIDENAGISVSTKVKDDIFLSFQRHMAEVDESIKLKALTIVLEMLEIAAARKISSQDTIVLESSNGAQVSDTNNNADLLTRTKRRRVNDNAISSSSVASDGQKHGNTKSSSAYSGFNMRTRADLNEYPQDEQVEDADNSNEINPPVSDLSNIPRATDQVLQHDKNDSSLQKSCSLDYMMKGRKCNTSSGFSIEQDNCSEKNLFQGFENETPPRNIAIMNRSMACIAENYADSEQSSESHTSRKKFLHEARKKYFFKDSSTPSFRLFEWEDDNGKVIEERELWRPLNSHSQHKDDYEIEIDELDGRNCNDVVIKDCETPRNKINKVEGLERTSDDMVLKVCQTPNNKIKEVERREDSSNEMVRKVYETPSNKGYALHTEYETIVQCAQRTYSNRTPSNHGITNSLLDLTTGFVNSQGEYVRNENSNPNEDYSPSDHSKHVGLFENSGLQGRRLFTEDVSDQKSQPERILKEKQSVSPEIQFLGERKAVVNSSDLSAQADDYYNTVHSLGNAGSSVGKENSDPKRFMFPSKFLSSPYDNNFTNAITPYELKLYEAITTLCDIQDHKDMKAVDIDNCTVSMEQIGKSMKPSGCVEAYVINAFCRKLFKDNHPSKSKKHFFFHTSSEYFLEKWKTDGARLRWKENVMNSLNGANRARKLHLSERLYFPSHYNFHWFIFCVDIKAKKFYFLDSLYGQHCSFHEATVNKMKSNFISTWYDAGFKDMQFDDYEVIFPRVPKQTTGTCCGIFLMKLLELWCPRNPAQYAFTQKDIPYFRIRLAIDNIFNPYNKADDARKLIRNFNVKAYKKWMGKE